MEINETLLRQIIEEVLSEMKSGADKPVSFSAPAAFLSPLPHRSPLRLCPATAS